MGKYCMVGIGGNTSMDHNGNFILDSEIVDHKDFEFESPEEAIEIYTNRWEGDEDFVEYNEDNPMSPIVGVWSKRK